MRYRGDGSVNGRSAGDRLRRFGVALYRQSERAGAHRHLAFQKADVLRRRTAGYKIGRRSKSKTIGISSFGSDTDLSMKIYAASGKLDPDKDMKTNRRRIDGHPSPRT